MRTGYVLKAGFLKRYELALPSYLRLENIAAGKLLAQRCLRFYLQ